MGTAVLIGQQRLGEKRSNIQLSTLIDIMPFYSSLFSPLPLPPLLSPVSLSLSLSLFLYWKNQWGQRRGADKQAGVCVCVRIIWLWSYLWVRAGECLGVFLGVSSFSLFVCLYRSLFIQISIVCLFHHLQMWFLMFRGNCVNSTPMHQVMIRIKCQHVTYAVLRMAWFPLRNQF